VVLDPFGGAGTTGLVADRLGRDSILIELNPDYAAMATARLRAALCVVDAPDVPLPAPGDAGGMFAEAAE
jgi:DNA modification methylase